MDERVHSGTRRAQSAIDLFLSLVAAMLAWPFPIARALLTPAAHVVLILMSWLILDVLYFAVALGRWRRTVGMYLMGIRPAAVEGGAFRARRAATWGAVAAMTALLRVCGLASAADALEGPDLVVLRED